MQPEPLTRGREGEREEEEWTLTPETEAITAWGEDRGEGESYSMWSRFKQEEVGLSRPQA